MSDDKKLYSLEDIRMIQEHAVLNAEVAYLKDTVPQIFASLKALTKSVDKDMKDLETRLDTRITSEVLAVTHKVDKLDATIKRAAWTVSGFITAATITAGIIFWFLSNTNIEIT